MLTKQCNLSLSAFEGDGWLCISVCDPAGGNSFAINESLTPPLTPFECVWAVKRPSTRPEHPHEAFSGKRGQVNAHPNSGIITVCAQQTAFLCSAPLSSVS